jgi:hypothetical protein
MVKTLFIWIILVVSVAGISIKYLSFDPTFPYYDTDLAPHYSRLESAPAHFDGIHYLRIMAKGYDDEGEQAFFPVYPLAIRAVSWTGLDPILSALLINLLCLLGLTTLISRRSLLLLLSFPASLFFMAVYTEPLFIFLLALSWSLLAKKQYLYAALTIGLLSGVKIVGIAMVIPLMIALWPNIARIILYLPLATSGLISYMTYLWLRFGDPLKFFHVQPMFGGGRSGDTLILLPQILYRYARMILTFDFNSFAYARLWWELLSFLLFGWLLFLWRKHLSLSAWWYCLVAILLPTLSGTLSSFPRYALAALPIFTLAASRLSHRNYLLVVTANTTLLIAMILVFVRGWFVA